MYAQFIFKDGSNPYITRTNKEFFRMMKKYDPQQISRRTFECYAEANHTDCRNPRISNYEKNKEAVRTIAINWQYDFEYQNYSYGDLSEWQDFFTEYGRKYGLLKEFHENAIC